MNELLSAQPERKHRAGLSRIMIAHVAVELLAENGVLYILGGPPAFPFANAEAFARAGQIPEDLYQGGEDEFRRLIHDIQANLRGPIRAYKFEIWAGDAQPEAYGAGALERTGKPLFVYYHGFTSFGMFGGRALFHLHLDTRRAVTPSLSAICLSDRPCS